MELNSCPSPLLRLAIVTASLPKEESNREREKNVNFIVETPGKHNLNQGMEVNIISNVTQASFTPG